LMQHVPDAQQRGLCIGFDGRHKSRELVEEVRAIANGAGFVVHAFVAPAPTPLLAYAVLDRADAGGVMITASHNPAAYNGYKVYWANGAQLNTPCDQQIAARIATAGPVLALPRLPLTEAQAAGFWRSLAGVEARYLAGLREALGEPATAFAPHVAYTALHGVGEPWARATLAAAGATHVDSVREQAQPDPDFPTVRFPNPEEPGTLDRLFALAEQVHADLALANDPDADRLALALPTASGRMQALSGNELGALLCDYLLARAPRDGRNLIVTSLVSTPLTERIAQHHGARIEITLTGFKWMIARSLALASEGYRPVLAFEEAIGYCIGELVRDKDGVAAAAHVVRMAQWHRAQGRSLAQALDRLYEQHGLFVSEQRSLSLTGAGALANMQRRLTALRAQPPTHLAGLPVTAQHDLARPDNALGLPPSDVLRYELAHAHRITIRPSGTEPKLKIYLDCSAQLRPGDTVASVRPALQDLSERLASEVAALLA
ncbi:MAG: phospho-sugar mutase, partial [Polyangiales bacterium]